MENDLLFSKLIFGNKLIKSVSRFFIKLHKYAPCFFGL